MTNPTRRFKLTKLEKTFLENLRRKRDAEARRQYWHRVNELRMRLDNDNHLHP